ncbi:hypothetical protein GCM10020219_092790 [Nonomuraea dietziae]
MAWVESPLQMLCAVEAHHAGLLGDRTLVVPRAGLRPLAATRRELVGLALPEGLELAKPQERMPRRLNAVGDAFSGRVQLRWITSRSGRVVIVDDGPGHDQAARTAVLWTCQAAAAGPRHSQRVARHAGPARGAAAARGRQARLAVGLHRPARARQAG